MQNLKMLTAAITFATFGAAGIANAQETTGDSNQTMKRSEAVRSADPEHARDTHTSAYKKTYPDEAPIMGSELSPDQKSELTPSEKHWEESFKKWDADQSGTATCPRTSSARDCSPVMTATVTTNGASRNTTGLQTIPAKTAGSICKTLGSLGAQPSESFATQALPVQPRADAIDVERGDLHCAESNSLSTWRQPGPTPSPVPGSTQGRIASGGATASPTALATPLATSSALVTSTLGESNVPCSNTGEFAVNTLTSLG